MKKQKENLFAQKFRLLSSQDSEEICWSSSDSSDYENVSSNIDKVCNFRKESSRKRKRKQSGRKNISNLDITVIDVSTEHKNRVKTEIFVEKHEDVSAVPKSPILGLSQYFAPYKSSNIPSSPIITSKALNCQIKGANTLKSPILVLKSASPKVSPNIRKKLFTYDKNDAMEVNNSNKSQVLSQNQCLDRRKSVTKDNIQLNNILHPNKEAEELHQQIIKDYSTDHNYEFKISNTSSSFCKKKVPLFNKTFVKEEIYSPNDNVKCSNTELIEDFQVKTEDVCVIEETPEPNMDESIVMLKTSNTDLAKKVKNYFDNQFSSDNASQQTISQVSTQKNSSKTSDDVEIINIPTQVLTNKNSMTSMDSMIENQENKKDKKIRYKKDGLAYRLNNLLKKQTASISLWRHEKFLAANSNFVIPKGEFLALRVCEVNFKYDCYLLRTMDFNDDIYMVLINSYCYNDNILTDSILKLYEPYTIVNYINNCKLIINVTKYECVVLKK